MIIDAHQHAYWNGKDAADLIKDMDTNGITKAWLLNWDIAPDENLPTFQSSFNPQHIRPDGTHPGITLSDGIMACNRYPDRFILGYAPHPLLDNPANLFEFAVKNHNVKICGELKARILMNDPRCINLFRKAGELGCPVILHIDIPYIPNGQGPKVYFPNWSLGTLENLKQILVMCPETNFIGHAPGFWREISGDADSCKDICPSAPVKEGGKLCQLFETFPNVYGDLSANSGLHALSRDTDHAKKFISTYADRLLFGRDCHGSELQHFLDSIHLPSDIMSKIYVGNAQKLLYR